MNLDIRGIRKSERPDHGILRQEVQKSAICGDIIHDLTITVTRRHWDKVSSLRQDPLCLGAVKLVSTDCYELYEGIELLVDKIEAAARKEKGKIQEH
jgi:putative sigma-54 modulation protein